MPTLGPQPKPPPQIKSKLTPEMRQRLKRLDAPEQWCAFDSLATWVAVLQNDGLVLFANAALENAIGISRRNIKGTLFAGYFTDPQMLGTALTRMQRDLLSELHSEVLFQGLGHETAPVHMVLSQDTDSGSPRHILVELLPMQHFVKIEREERLLAQVQANKALIRNLAHEIKNPLGGIRGAAQLLQMQPSADELQEYTAVIIHEADRLQLLVDRLLAPHRHPQQLGEVNIHEVCEHVAALIEAEFGPLVRVQRDYDTSIPELRGDRGQLVQAVLNIANNAALALTETNTNNNINTESTAKPGKHPEIIFRSRIARQISVGRQRYRLALELHIIDNGPGVPANLQEQIFAPLVSGRYGGTGLGLTLAQTFVQQHQGLIECDSVPGKTDFKIVIPLP